MKTSVFLFALLVATTLVSAQSPDDYRAKMNSVFTNLNPADISTGYLSEYAYPLMPMENFDGNLNSNNVTNTQIWQMLYTTWYSAYLASSSIPGSSPSTVYTAIQNALNSSSAIPISILLARYNTLKPDAVNNNLLSVSNDQLYDVPGRAQSPYDERVLFAAAPAKPFSSSNQISFVFNSSLVWGNGPSINSVEIDFGEGAGYQSISWGTPISHTFSSTGGKRINIRVTPSVGNTVESHFDMQVLDVDVCVGCRYNLFFDDVHVIAASGNHSGGRAFIHYSQNNSSNPRRIIKPLIVAEGYDANSVAPLLSEDYTSEDFVRALNLLGGANPNSYDFNAALDNASYDIVFLNYNNGTDDIPRNAALLQEVIQWVNGQKQPGDQQNVVMGLSMGGLVGRYALAQMVRNSVDSQTRLLITHDSPHRGANVPLGFQILARLAGSTYFTYNIFGNTAGLTGVRDIVPELDQALDLLEAPASTQLLIIRATDGFGNTAFNTFLDNDYRNMVNLSSTPYRIVATSDGSQCGAALFAPATTLASFSAYGFLSPIPWITNNRIKTDLDINALANQQSNQLIHLKIYSSWTLFSLITINITLLDRSINGPAVPAYDGATGGTRPLSAYLGNDFNPSGSFKVAWFLQAGYNVSLANGFCFSPTASALDVTTFDAPSLTAVYVDAVSPANPSRAGRFIAQESYTNPNTFTTAYNEEHIRFTARNGQWIYNEMENPGNNTLHCTSECPVSGLSISGPDFLCSTATYAVSPTQPGATFAWTSSNGGIFSIDANSGVAAFVSGGSGTVTTTVNGCAISGLSKTIWVGVPQVPTFLVNSQPFTNGTVCKNSQQYIQAMPFDANNSYTWSIASGNPGNASLSQSGNTAIFQAYASECFGVSVQLLNSCGTTQTGLSFCAQDCFSAYKIFPNPARDDISVEFERVEKAEALPDQIELLSEGSTKPIQSIDVQDAYQGRKLINGNSIVLTVKELPRGTYYLHIKNSRNQSNPVDKIRIVLE